MQETKITPRIPLSKAQKSESEKAAPVKTDESGRGSSSDQTQATRPDRTYFEPSKGRPQYLTSFRGPEMQIS